MMFCNNLLKISKYVSEISEKDRNSLFFIPRADTNAMVSHSQQIFNSELEKVITISFESNFDAYRKKIVAPKFIDNRADNMRLA